MAKNKLARAKIGLKQYSLLIISLCKIFNAIYLRSFGKEMERKALK
jgi:hypothetical protein